MYWFKKMIEIARMDGIGDILNPKQSEPVDPEHFFKSVEKAEVFVFHPSHEPTTDLENEVEVIDAPFPVFSVEMSDNVFLTIAKPGEMIKVNIACIMTIEEAPKKYKYYVLAETDWYYKNKKYFVMLASKEFVGRVVQAMMDRLQTERDGVEKTKERLKIGRGDSKRTLTVRRIVHVAPKKLQSTVTPLSGRSINWSHAWSVRGHWREHRGVGKDRNGDYCVQGHTWVRNHTKGDKSKPVVRKTRVVGH